MRLRIVGNRTHLDTSISCGRYPRRDPNCFIQIFRIDEVVAPDLFLRFGEGAICHDGFAIAHADGRGGGGRFEPVRANKMALRFEPVGEL